MSEEDKQALAQKNAQLEADAKVQLEKKLIEQKNAQTLQLDQAEYEQRVKEADAQGLQGPERTRFVLTKQMSPSKEPTARDDAFQAYADAHGKDVTKLTATDKIAAVRRGAGAPQRAWRRGAGRRRWGA